MTDDEQADDEMADPGEEESPEAEESDLSGLDLDPDELDPEPEPEDGDDESDESGSQSDAGEGADPGGSSSAAAGEWGDMYVSMCAQATTGIIEKHGDGHEVGEDHFRAVNLDQHFNATLEKYRKSSDMEPEQALVVGTLVAVGGPVALHTDLIADLSGEFDL